MDTTDKSKIINFIGIGAPKSGSTWISKCLEEHPDILFSSERSRKELHFFNVSDTWGDNSTGRMSYYERGVDWYLLQFPEHREGAIRGEYSVTYMSDPVAYKRIKKWFPDVKIIVILRNPVNMVYSLYWYFYHGAVIDVGDSFSECIKNGVFVEKGYYYKYLKNYFELFSRDNIHVMLFDDLKKDPLKTVQECYDFLGVDSTYLPPSLTKRMNESFVVRFEWMKNWAHNFLARIDRLGWDSLRLRIFESKRLYDVYSKLNKKQSRYMPMSDSTRKMCYKLYEQDINDLEKLIKRDLSNWKY